MLNTATITVKTDPKTKKAAQQLAEDLGFSLSGVMNGLVKEFIRTKSLNVSFHENEGLELTEYAKKSLAESEADRKAGRVSPSFTSAKDAIEWLNSDE